MRIGYDAKRFFHNASGLGNYSRDLVRIMAQTFPDNEYFLYDKKPSERSADLLHRENIHFKPTRNGLFARQRLVGRQAQQDGCALFHGLSGELPLYWAKTSIKKIVTLHDLIFLRYPQYYKRVDVALHKYKFSQACHQADHIIAISNQTKQDLVDFFTVSPEKISVIYQGCQAVFKAPVAQHYCHQVVQKFALPEKFLLSVGTIEERKNQLRIAMAAVNKNIPVVFVGRKQKKYFAALEKLRNDNRTLLYFPEGVSSKELAALYQVSSGTVYTSIFEGFGIPIIESLFSGKVPVVTNSGAMKEAAGPHGLYINCTSVEDIGAKMHFLWNNPSAGDHILKNVSEHLQQFTDPYIAKKYAEIYDL